MTFTKRCKSAIGWLRGLWPMTTRRHNRAMALAMQDACERAHAVRKEHSKAIKELEERVAVHVRRLSSITCLPYDRNRRYAVTVTLDSEMMRGYQGQEDLDFIARIVGDDVRHHIATSKFVQDVDNLRREQYERDRSRWTLP